MQFRQMMSFYCWHVFTTYLKMNHAKYLHIIMPNFLRISHENTLIIVENFSTKSLLRI